MDGELFTMEIGMTWKQWCDSSYNPGDFFVESGAVLLEDVSTGWWYTVTGVKPDDLIRNGGVYKSE